MQCPAYPKSTREMSRYHRGSLLRAMTAGHVWISPVGTAKLKPAHSAPFAGRACLPGFAGASRHASLSDRARSWHRLGRHGSGTIDDLPERHRADWPRLAGRLRRIMAGRTVSDRKRHHCRAGCRCSRDGPTSPENGILDKPEPIGGLSDDERTLLGEALRRERGARWNAACDAAEAQAKRPPSLRADRIEPIRRLARQFGVRPTHWMEE